MGRNLNLDIFGSKPRPAGWLEAARKLVICFNWKSQELFLSHPQICFCPGSNLDLVLAGLGGQRVLVEVLEVGVEERLQEQG